jgi:ammonia channel protein AmtB
MRLNENKTFAPKASGSAAVAYTMILGERHARKVVSYKPHNLIQVVLGKWEKNR